MAAAGGIVVPEHFNFATDRIDAWAKDPKKVALHWVDAACEEERVITFAELAEQSRAVAGALQADGLRPGDRVIIASDGLDTLENETILKTSAWSQPGVAGPLEDPSLMEVSSGSVGCVRHRSFSIHT